MKQGLIPARAGKTTSYTGIHLTVSAHPRACGENLNSLSPYRCHVGSSPRVRGQRDGFTGLDHPIGLIPARAGKTSDSLRSSLGDRAHPRACGENLVRR